MHTLLVPGQKGFLLTDIGRLIHKSFEERALRMGYTRPQWQVLSLLSQHPGMTQVKLAGLMEIEPITLSRHIDRMEKEQWLERRPDQNDRRVNRLFLRPSAEKHLKHLETLRDELLQCVFAAVPAESEEMIRGVLTDVRKNLVEYAQNLEKGSSKRDAA